MGLYLRLEKRIAYWATVTKVWRALN